MDLVGLCGEGVAEDVVLQVTLTRTPGVVAAIRHRQLTQLHIMNGKVDAMFCTDVKVCMRSLKMAGACRTSLHQCRQHTASDLSCQLVAIYCTVVLARQLS